MPRLVPPRTEAVGRRSWRHQPRRRPNYLPARAGEHSAETGGIGAILRREGVYSSTLCDWRRQRDAGTFGALTPAKRGPKTEQPHPLEAKMALLQRNNADLTRRLARADAIIAVQKKLADLLGIPMTPDGSVP